MRRNEQKKAGSLTWMLRRDLFLGAVVLVIVFLLIPFNGMNTAANIGESIRCIEGPVNEETRAYFTKQLTTEFMYIHPLNLEMLTVILLGIGFFGALVIFRHLFGRNQSQMIFSLPVTRARDFLRRMLCGAVLCIVPTLLALAVYPLLLSFRGLGEYLSAGLYLKKALSVVLLELYGFSLGSLCAVLCGTAWAAVLAGGVIGASVEGFLLIWNTLSSYFLRTMITAGLQKALMWCSPVFSLYKSFYNPEHPVWLAGILAIAVMILLAFAAYRRRGSEMADRTLALNGLKIPLKIWLTLVGAAVVTFLAVKMLGTEAAVFGAAVAGVLAAWVLTAALMEQSLKSVTKQWGIPLCCAAVMVLVLGCLHLDVTGYDRYLPETAEVTAVEYRDLDRYPVRTVRLTSRDAVEGAMGWAKGLRDQVEEKNRKSTFERPAEWSGVQITYELANGRKISRAYTHLTDNTAVTDSVRAMVESDDFRFSQEVPEDGGFYATAQLNTMGLDSYQFAEVFGFSTRVEIPEAEQKRLLPLLRESYRKDCAARTLETYQDGPMLEIYFYGEYTTETRLVVYPDDRNTAELLLGAEEAEKWISHAKGGWARNEDLILFKVTRDLSDTGLSYSESILTCEKAADAAQAEEWVRASRTANYYDLVYCAPPCLSGTELLVYSRTYLEYWQQYRSGLDGLDLDSLPMNDSAPRNLMLKFLKQPGTEEPTGEDTVPAAPATEVPYLPEDNGRGNG